jgi:hypothetical protein
MRHRRTTCTVAGRVQFRYPEDTMLRLATITTTLVAAFALSVAGAAAQRSSDITMRRGEFAIVPYGGYLLTESFIDGPLETSLGAVSAPLFGVQASLPLAPGASLVGSVGYAAGDLEIGLPILGGIDVGRSNALVLDAGIELRAGGNRFAPLLQLGGGAIRREVTVAGISASTTDFQVSGGIGADLPIANNIALRLMAKDHYGKSDFGGLGELRARTKELHNVALTAGLNFRF